jgi:hypothetical protein
MKKLWKDECVKDGKRSKRPQKKKKKKKKKNNVPFCHFAAKAPLSGTFKQTMQGVNTL